MSEVRIYRLADLAKRLGRDKGVIIRWEAEGRIPPAERDNHGWRFYTPDDFDLLVRGVEAGTYPAKSRATYQLAELAKELQRDKTTLIRWEMEGRIPPARRDERGWRYYTQDDFDAIVRLVSTHDFFATGPLEPKFAAIPELPELEPEQWLAKAEAEADIAPEPSEYIARVAAESAEPEPAALAATTEDAAPAAPVVWPWIVRATVAAAAIAVIISFASITQPRGSEVAGIFSSVGSAIARAWHALFGDDDSQIALTPPPPPPAPVPAPTPAPAPAPLPVPPPPVVEREVVVREREVVREVPVAAPPAAADADIVSRVISLETRLSKAIGNIADLYSIADATGERETNVVTTFAPSQSIDRLAGVTFIEGTNTFNLTDADIPDSITVSGYLSSGGGSISGPISVSGSGTSTFAHGLTVATGGGNFGVGTSSPTKFASFAGELLFGSSGGTSTNIGSQDIKEHLRVASLEILGACDGCPGAGSSNAAGAAGTVQFSDGASAFDGDAANFFWDNSAKRLGIGTGTPGATLSVNGGAIFVSTSTFIGGLVTPSISATSTLGIYAGGAAAPRLLIDASGNVGIGSTTPAAPFAVANRILFGSAGATSTNIGALDIKEHLRVSSLEILGSCKGCPAGGGSGTINAGTTNRLAYYSDTTTLDS
ncbi:MerR family transcriptional regulator, partial [Candidatus Parcubacteria bacterium]